VIAVVLISDVLNGRARATYLSVSHSAPDTNRKRCGPMQPAWVSIFMIICVRTFSVDLDGGAIVAYQTCKREANP
jgi:hypothetical protein